MKKSIIMTITFHMAWLTIVVTNNLYRIWFSMISTIPLRCPMVIVLTKESTTGLRTRHTSQRAFNAKDASEGII